MLNKFKKLINKLFSRQERTDLLVDADNDGLSDREEKKYGTDPHKYDTDNDGLSDYEEVKIYHTDPLDPDTDHDGIPDGQEIRQGTNPLGAGKLKDLFYSYPGNNYRPEFLRPGRIAWYGISALLIKIIVIAYVGLMPISAWLTPDLAKEEAQKIIALTNGLRMHLNLQPLQENQALDQAAADKVRDMLAGQYFSHFNNQGQGLEYWLKKNHYAYAVAGENLALGFTDAASAFAGWVKSQTHYANLIDADYSQIGVAIENGAYRGQDTSMIAQYFGAPQTANLNSVKPSILAKTAPLLKGITAGKKIVLGKTAINAADQTATSSVSLLAVDSQAPLIDEQRSFLSLSSPPGDWSVIQATAYLSTDTAQAQVQIGSLKINLISQAGGKWTGSAIISQADKNKLLNPVIMGTIRAADAMGKETVKDISWNNVQILQPSLLDQYFALRENQPEPIKAIMSISGIYYDLLLLVVIAVLAMNILIKIKIQQPKIIIPALGLIVLLLAMIII